MTSTIDHINSLNARILAGEDVSATEMHEVIKQLRSERANAAGKQRERRDAKEAANAPVDLLALIASTTPAADDTAIKNARERASTDATPPVPAGPDLAKLFSTTPTPPHKGKGDLDR